MICLLSRKNAKEFMMSLSRTHPLTHSTQLMDEAKAALAGIDWGDLEDFYTAARGETAEALMKLKGALEEGWAAVLPLIKVEIFRDVYQALGMFFSKLFAGAKEGMNAVAKTIFGFIGNILAFDWAEAIPVETLV